MGPADVAGERVRVDNIDRRPAAAEPQANPGHVGGINFIAQIGRPGATILATKRLVPLLQL